MRAWKEPKQDSTVTNFIIRTAACTTNPMTRPNFDSPPNLHGQMQYLAEIRDVPVADLYLVATKVLVNLDPDSDYDPNDTDLVDFYLDQCNG